MVTYHWRIKSCPFCNQIKFLRVSKPNNEEKEKKKKKILKRNWPADALLLSASVCVSRVIHFHLFILLFVLSFDFFFFKSKKKKTKKIPSWVDSPRHDVPRINKTDDRVKKKRNSKTVWSDIFFYFLRWFADPRRQWGTNESHGYKVHQYCRQTRWAPSI